MVSKHSSRRLRQLLQRAAALAAIGVLSPSAFAVDATWDGADSTYNNPTNWNPDVVPDDTARFGASGSSTVNITSPSEINRILFTQDAQPYFIGNYSTYSVNGEGVINRSSFTHQIYNAPLATLSFNNNAAIVGGTGVDITNRGTLFFNDTAHTSGASVRIFNEGSTGSTASLTFSDGSYIDGARLNNLGGSATSQSFDGSNVVTTGGSSNAYFYNNSHADNATIVNGLAHAEAESNDSAGYTTAVGGASTLVFSDKSHADGTSLTNQTGDATATSSNGIAGGATGGNATAVSGASSLQFYGESHADNSFFSNIGGNATATAGSGAAADAASGGMGGASTAVGGFAATTFDDDTHADNSEFHIGSGGATAIAGSGGAGATATGGAGGAATAVSSGASVTFNDNAHADNSSFTLSSGSASSVGANGGAGGSTGGGGNGGSATAVTGSTSLVLNDFSHADDSDFAINGGSATAVGGTGGNGLSAAGGAGSSGTSVAGGSIISFNDSATANGAEFSLQGGSAVAVAGSGGAGGAAAGGAGGSAVSIGGNATLNFNDNTSAGDAIIDNRGSNAAAVGGAGGDGGTTGAGGAGGSATAVGGSSLVVFSDNANAGSAFITNTGGTSTAVNGSAGSTNGAAGGAGGTTTAFAGSAEVRFNDSANAADATIINNGGGVTSFFDASNGGNATITNNDGGTTLFSDDSNAGFATITNNFGGQLDFAANAQGENATVINNIGGLVTTTSANGDVSIGSLSGAGNVLVGANDLILGNLDLLDEISGEISSSGGGLTKVGTGTLLLSGANTYTGDTKINDGILQLNGSVTSDVYVNDIGSNNAQLQGIGIINGDLFNQRFLTPGGGYASANQLGTLTVNGTFNNLSGGFYYAIIDDSGNHNSLAAQTSNLSGGLFALPVGGLFLDQNQYDYTIVTNSVARNGGFVFVAEDELPYYLDASLSYPGNDVQLTLTRNAQAPSASDFSENQRALAEYLDDVTGAQPEALILLQPLYRADNLNELQLVLSAGSGDALTAFPFASQQVGIRFNERMESRTVADRVLNEQIAALTRGTPRFAYSGNRYRTLLAQNPTATSSTQTQSTLAAAEQRASNIWATVARAHDDGDSDGNGPGFRARATEYQLGYDRKLGSKTIVGISIGKSDGDVDVEDRDARADLDTTSIGLYAQQDNDNWYWNGAISYNRHKIESERIPPGSIIPVPSVADYRARTVALAGEIGKRYGKGKYSVEPNLSLKWNNTRTDDFAEEGPSALEVEGNRYNTRRLGLGVRVVNRDATARIRPHLFVGYEREFGDDQVELNNQLSGLGGTFTVRGTELGKNIWTARLGANARLSDRFSLVGEVGASWRENQDSQYIYGGIKYGW